MPNQQLEKSGHSKGYRYAGFWIRFGATIIDTLIILCVTFPVLFLFYGKTYLEPGRTTHGIFDVIVQYVMPLIATILFWTYKSATPGKMAVKAVIVDAKTGGKPTMAQFLIRYFGYLLSTIPLCLGFFWIAWDAKKQGWHDKLAGTVIIRPTEKDSEMVEFEARSER